MIKIVLIPGKIGLLAKLHHIISDAWTLSLIATQFNELIKGDGVQAFSYLDYIKEENEYVAGKRYQKIGITFSLSLPNATNPHFYRRSRLNHFQPRG